jgi:hypothetical protein
MYQETVRQMNDRERDVLREDLSAEAPVSGRGTVKWILVCLAGLVFLTLPAAGLMALKPPPIVGGLVGGLLGVLAIVCIYALIALVSSFFHWRRVWEEMQRDTFPALRKALEEGQVRSRQVIASAVIEIVESEDEGSAYIFDIGDGRSLLLKGQRYVPVDDAMPWPASEFEIVRSADGEIWIGLFSTGKTLMPLQSLSMADGADDFVWSEREDVLTGSLQAVLQSLLKAPRPGNPNAKS